MKGPRRIGLGLALAALASCGLKGDPVAPKAPEAASAEGPARSVIGVGVAQPEPR